MENISQLDKLLFSLVSQDNWQWQIVFIIFATIVVNFFVAYSLHKIEAHVQNTKNVWDDAILHAAYLPVRLLGWLIGLTLILAILHQQHSIEAISSMFFQFRKVAFISVLGLFLYRLIHNMHRSIVFIKHKIDDKFDVASIDAIAKLLSLSVIIITALTILQVLGYSISGILAFGGMGGIAVGFAAKDLLANFFGGLMIYLDKPFKAGDWIRSPDRDIEGTVEHIGWRISRIRTFDKRPLYIPNALFTNIIVENPSRMSHRRINETIGIRYEDWQHMQAIVTEVKSMLIHHQGIDETQTLICNFTKFNDSSLDFFIYAFTKTTDWTTYHAIKQEILLKVFDIIASHHAKVAIPTQKLLIQQ